MPFAISAIIMVANISQRQLRVQLEVGLKALKARNSKAQGVSPVGRMEQ
jgi:hypothetical protein